MTISLTERELDMLLTVCTEYCEVMGEAEDTKDFTEYMMETGLGSALRKISKGKKLETAYKKYKTFSKYPTFEEWVAKKAGSEEVWQ